MPPRSAACLGAGGSAGWTSGASFACADAAGASAPGLAVVSNSGKVDTSTPLFTSGAGFLLLPENAPAQSVDTVRAGVGTLDLAAAIAQLDVGFAQVEGGPGLNGSLLDADLVDELNLTISPQLAGGDGPRVTNGAAAASQRMRLAHVLEDDGFLFTRYVRA